MHVNYVVVWYWTVSEIEIDCSELSVREALEKRDVNFKEFYMISD